MILVIVLLVFVCIGLPLYYSWRLWHLHETTRTGWLSRAAEAALLVALVMIVGRWDIAGYYLRFLLLAIGRVGNSGNTTEPHLHIHAVDRQTGAALPVAFAGRAPLRNRTY